MFFRSNKTGLPDPPEKIYTREEMLAIYKRARNINNAGDVVFVSGNILLACAEYNWPGFFGIWIIGDHRDRPEVVEYLRSVYGNLPLHGIYKNFGREIVGPAEQGF